MEEKAQISDDSSDAPYRRRGRPTGKNRVPLSLKERRARNAQYERQRRHETSEAIAELTVAVGCNPNLSNSDILATAISQLQKAATLNNSREIKELKESNMKLIQKIEALEQRLLSWEQNRTSPEYDKKYPISCKRKRTYSNSERALKRVIETEEGFQTNIKSEPSQSSEKFSSDDEHNLHYNEGR